MTYTHYYTTQMTRNVNNRDASDQDTVVEDAIDRSPPWRTVMFSGDFTCCTAVAWNVREWFDFTVRRILSVTARRGVLWPAGVARCRAGRRGWNMPGTHADPKGTKIKLGQYAMWAKNQRGTKSTDEHYLEGKNIDKNRKKKKFNFSCRGR